MSNDTNIHIGSCRLIFGPMFSGKSTTLRKELTTLADIGLKVLYINHSSDIRKTEKGDKIITTHHSGFKGLSDKITVIKNSNLRNIDINKYDVIGIDESQFFDELDEVVREWVLFKNKHVIVASLDGDYMMRPFGKAHNLISICESGDIIKLAAICSNCINNSIKDGKIIRVSAGFTAKINIIEDIQIDIGGTDKYIPLCMRCYKNHMINYINNNEPIVSSINLDKVQISKK